MTRRRRLIEAFLFGRRSPNLKAWADDIGLSPTTLSRLRAGTTVPNVTEVRALAAALRVPAAEIVRRLRAIHGDRWQQLLHNLSGGGR
jgi:transcriptional regulator with XRE-family HTH domain